MRFIDTFERTNRDLPGTTPDGWAWVVDSGTGTSAWGIVGGRLCRKGDSKTAPISINKRLLTENQKFSLNDISKVATGTANLWLGLVLRFVDTANYHLIRYNPPTGAVSAQIVIQQVGGASGNPVTVNIATPADGWTLAGTIKRSGTTVTTEVLINGTVAATHTSTQFAAWPTTDNGTQGTVKLTGYANSARLNDESRSLFVGSLVIQDLVQPSRYKAYQWNGTAEVPVEIEGAFLEYVIGESDPNLPNGLLSYPSKYPVQY